MNAALPSNVVALPMNLTDLPMSKELDQEAMKQLAGGHRSSYSSKTYTLYTSTQTQSIGFLKRHRKVYHKRRITVRNYHTYGAWGGWHVHF